MDRDKLLRVLKEAVAYHHDFTWEPWVDEARELLEELEDMEKLNIKLWR